IGSQHTERAVAELDISWMSFENMCCDSLALVDDLVERLDHCRTANDQGARCRRPATVSNLIGITLHQGHAFVVDAEPFAHDLRKRRLMALPLAVRATVDCDRSRRMHPDLGGLEARSPCAEVSDHPRRNSAGDLDVCGDAQPTQLAPAPGFDPTA